MLFTFTIQYADGTTEVLFRHATFNVVQDKLDVYAGSLTDGDKIIIEPYVKPMSPLADWEIELLTGRKR